MIWVADRLGEVTFLSPEWVKITGRSREDGLGDGWKDGIHSDDADVVLPVYEAAVRAKSGLTLQYRLRVADQSYIWVISGAVPSIDPEGNFIGYLGSVTKIEDHALLMLRAGGRLGPFKPPAPNVFTVTQEALGLAADHMLMAHALLLSNAPVDDVISPLERAMGRIAVRLANSISDTPLLN